MSATATTLSPEDNRELFDRFIAMMARERETVASTDDQESALAFAG